MALDWYHSAYAYILIGLAGCSVAIAVLVLAAHIFQPGIPPRPDLLRCLCGHQSRTRFGMWLHHLRWGAFR